MAPPPAGQQFTGPIPTGQMPPVPPPMAPPRRAWEGPSPLGLAMALIGLILMCVSVLIPRISIQSDETDSYTFYSLTSLDNNGAALGAETVVLVVVLLAAVGLSAAGSQALRWPARMTAVGVATFAAAFAYHPVSAVREMLSQYDSIDEGISDTEVTAESGIYLMIFAVALLAASTFFMHVKMNRAAYQSPPPQHPAPGPGQGPAPTVTVTPG